jgi:hypothetical protein
VGGDLQARRRVLEERAEALRAQRHGLIPAAPPMRAAPGGVAPGGVAPGGVAPGGVAPGGVAPGGRPSTSGGARNAGGHPPPPVAWGSGDLDGAAQHEYLGSVGMRPSPARRPGSGKRIRPGSAPAGGMHGSGSEGGDGSYPHSPGGEMGEMGDQIANTLGATGAMWPQMLGQRPRFAHAYAHNVRLQEIHSIYGQFIGPPRPAPANPNASLRHPAQRMAGGYGTILVGDYFPMPSSPTAQRQRPRSAYSSTHRRAPERRGPPQMGSLLDEAQRVAEQPLLH